MVTELLSSDAGSELYRVAIGDEFVGKSYRDYAVHMLDNAVSVIGLSRAHDNLINPDPSLRIERGDDAFVVAREPPQ